jgi:hypothetical protein
MKQSISYLYIYKKAYDSVRREVLYNIFIGFCVPMNLVRLVIMYLNETYSRVWVVKYCVTCFLLRMV